MRHIKWAQDKNSITTNTIQFRVIRYIVDKEVYYLGTTFVERAINVVDIGTTFVERAINVVDIGTTLRDSLFTIDVLKDLYWMRKLLNMI